MCDFFVILLHIFSSTINSDFHEPVRLYFHGAFCGRTLCLVVFCASVRMNMVRGIGQYEGKMDTRHFIVFLF